MVKKFLSQNQNLLKNIILGLFCGILVLGFSIALSSLLYQPKKMVKRGFKVKIETTQGQLIKKGAKKSQLNEKESKEIDIIQMIADANIKDGARKFKKCSTCHNIEKNGKNKIGPNLYGIIGQKIASNTKFSYSKVLKEKGGIWTVENLNLWLTNPKNFIPGNKMAFAGFKKVKDRANVIAYLKQQQKP